MTSSTFFHKPELALRRALELEGINQPDAALVLLHEVLSSRRQRTWSPSYEQIMITYLDLCLNLHRSREAKDGLHQYRNLSQSQAPGSLEKVIRYLMEKAEAKCSEAKASADAEAVLATTASTSGGADGDEEDGFGTSPQAILLSTMSTDPAKSQIDSTLLLPSLKFLWETYRAVLDILRSNSKLEHVYHSAAVGALRFCRVYKRRMEFRHLCDMLRMHLGNLRQYGSMKVIGEDGKTNNKVRGWEGWTTEAIELHLQTRFSQLETASVLHRYTEGFRTVEDIYNILQISQARRKANPDAPPPKAKLMAAYYEKLTTLFWVSENYLFHAFAWYKYYTLCKEYNRGMSEDTKRIQASAVLLAALCIPTLPNQAGTNDGKQHELSSTIGDDIIKQKMSRMATLLGFHTRNPNRDALLAEIRSKNILEQVPQYLKDLYLLMETDTDPLVLVDRARPLLDQLKKEIGATTLNDSEADNDDVEDNTLGRYVKPLTSVLLLKLLQNLSTAFHTVSMDHLKRLTAGLEMSFESVEKAIVLFTQSKALSVRLDHRAGCLRFGDAQLESDVMRSQLTVLSKQLEAVCHILHPPNLAARQSSRTALYQDVRAKCVQEHVNILERKNMIEKRKEEDERRAQEKIKQEQRLKAEEEAARKQEEEARIAREQRLREQDKLRKIQKELDNIEKKRFLSAMGHNTELTDEQIEKIDTAALQKEHQDKINKKKEEAERKTREVAKKLDYLVRAIRIEELPLIKKKYEEKTKDDKERYEAEVEEKKEKAKKQWEADVKDKAVLTEHGVFDYLDQFEAKVMEGRKMKHAELCRQAEDEAEIEAERAKMRRARKRKDDEEKRKAEEIRRQREEEQRLKEEEEQRKREEARREKEALEDERRKAEMARMEEERKKEAEAQEQRAPAGSRFAGARVGGPVTGSTGGKYVPPSRRGQGSAGGSDGGSRYPGGGRYEGRGGGGGGSSRFSDRDGGRDGGGRDGGRDGGGGGFRGGSSGGGGSGGTNQRWR